ncbi:MAG TPA: peptidoglycan-binding protein, partial [Kiloniellaceae bacterium]|nr:peptidoglycan-binding protein [Kiloniellaceae bacterium]
VVDGLYGGNTRRALEAFQQSEALPVTGLPDAATVAKLLQ